MEIFSGLLFNAVAFIFVISVIVFIHEFGHYYVAKKNGIKIEVFSIGFGKELFGFFDKSGTRWKVCLIPMGGYVKMFGDAGAASTPDAEKLKSLTKEEEKLAFHTKSLPIKAAVVSAGPIANFVLAVVILFFFFISYGKVYVEPVISQIMENSTASEAGLQIDDRILKIDGDEIKTFDDVQRIIALNTGTPVKIELERHSQIINLELTPKMVEREDAFGNTIKAPLIGIQASVSSYEKLGAIDALGASFVEVYHISAGTLKAIGQIITGSRSAKEITGPIGIAKYSGQSAEKGLSTLFWFMAIISVNLGLINLFPIPVLDGGHLLYYIVEAVRGKPMADKYQQLGFRFGTAFVLFLVIFAVYNDLSKIVG